MKKTYSIPLLKDHHTHLSFYSKLSNCINIGDILKKEDFYRRIEDLPDNKISVILGWNSSFYSFNREDEKNLPPVIISDISLHGVFISDKAKKIIPEKYKILVQNYKNPDWCEKNLYKIMLFLTSFYKININKLDKYFNSLLRLGLYYAEDMLISDEAFLNIIENSKYNNRTSFWADLRSYESLSEINKDKIKGIKVFADGALGSKTAKVSSGYLDGADGKLLYSDNDLYNHLLKVHKIKKSVSVHAIGDIAIKQVLNIVGKLKNNDFHFSEIRLEHCQFIDKNMAIEAKKLGLILSMQPNFSFETITYLDRLSKEFLKGNNLFRMLIDEAGFVSGKDLIFGSDGMPHGAYTALKSAFFPTVENQKLSLDEFVAGYCMETEKTGRIEFTIDYDMKDIINLKVIANK